MEAFVQDKYIRRKFTDEEPISRSSSRMEQKEEAPPPLPRRRGASFLTSTKTGAQNPETDWLSGETGQPQQPQISQPQIYQYIDPSNGAVYYFDQNGQQYIDSSSVQQTPQQTGATPGPQQMAYPQTGYDQQGFNQQGFNQQGFNQQGFNQQGFNQQGFPQQSFANQQTGMDKNSIMSLYQNPTGGAQSQTQFGYPAQYGYPQQSPYQNWKSSGFVCRIMISPRKCSVR